MGELRVNDQAGRASRRNDDGDNDDDERLSQVPWPVWVDAQRISDIGRQDVDRRGTTLRARPAWQNVANTCLPEIGPKLAHCGLESTEMSIGVSLESTKVGAISPMHGGIPLFFREMAKPKFGGSPATLPGGKKFQGSRVSRPLVKTPSNLGHNCATRTQRSAAHRPDATHEGTTRVHSACRRPRSLRRAEQRNRGKQRLPSRILSATQRELSIDVAVRMRIAHNAEY